MDEPGQKSDEKIPAQTAEKPTQSAGKPEEPVEPPDPAQGVLVGHPLPEAIRDIPQAFRSHPAWILIQQWIGLITSEHQECKIELSEIREKLKNQEVQNATLKGKLDGLKDVLTVSNFIITLGSITIGLSPSLSTPLAYVVLVAGLGITFFGWHHGRLKE